jgi:hypothetical protein
VKYFVTLIILLFPGDLYSEQPRFQKKLLPMFCMPIEAFEEGQEKVGEEQYVFGVVKNNPHLLFEIYKNKNLDYPTFSATLRQGNEICVLIAGNELLPVWWFEEKCL